MPQPDTIPQLNHELPFGAIFQGKTLRKFTPRRLNVRQLKKLNDAQIKVNRPFSWFAMALSLALESIEDEQIFSYYEAQVRQGSSTPWHPVLREMLQADALYALIASHVFTYNESIRKDLEVQCSRCNNKYVYNFDLSKTRVKNSEIKPDHTYTVSLPEGFKFTGSMAKDLGVEGVQYNRYEYRLSKLGDLMAAEGRFGVTSDSDFLEFLLYKMLVSVSTDKGSEFPKEAMGSLNTQLITELMAPDLVAINNAVQKNSPDITCEQDISCKKCGFPDTVEISPNFLFPMG